MYGLRAINNVYVPDGSGRDWLIVGHPEFVLGRSYSIPAPRDRNRITLPARKLPGRGPRPLTPARITALKMGLNPIQVEQMRKSGSAAFLGKGKELTLTGSKGVAELTRAQSAPALPSAS